MPVLYPFTQAINACFEIPTPAGQALIGGQRQPVESSYGMSVLAVTLFDFSDSPVGPYHELVLSLFVAPRLGAGERHPHAAVCPVRIASTHDAARRHAIDLWHLPHFMEDIRIDFQEAEDGRQASGTVLTDGDEPILELTVSHSGKWAQTSQLYQSFQRDESGDYMGTLMMDGELSEHERGTGSLSFAPHRFVDALDLSEIEPAPIREMWMKNGVESYLGLTRCGEPDRPAEWGRKNGRHAALAHCRALVAPAPYAQGLRPTVGNELRS
jgi:hypothetical protein